MFVDVIGIVVHVSNIRGRDDVRMRPYRYVVLMNEWYLDWKFYHCSMLLIFYCLMLINFVTRRYHCIIITVKYTHIRRHLSKWRRAASELRILAGLHVQMNRKRGIVSCPHMYWLNKVLVITFFCSCMIGGVTTTDDFSELVFSPICNQAHDFQSEVLLG